MTDKYLIYTTAHGNSDIILWWKPNSHGYTIDIDKAGRYSKEEVDAIESCRGEDFGIQEPLVVERTTQIVLRDGLLDIDKRSIGGFLELPT